MTVTTIAEILAVTAQRFSAAGIDDAHLEADVLLAHALRIDRARVLARLPDVPAAGDLRAFEDMVARRLRHEPLAYITGHREFYGLEFTCGPVALIPRQETELLVDIVLDEIASQSGFPRIVDVGTGTGAIAVAIAANAPNVTLVAVDASRESLALARRNAEAHRIARRITFAHGDLFETLGEFDIVVANLPYVAAGDWESLAPEIRLWEPRDALVAGPRGSEFIEKLLDQAPLHLALGGLLVAEIGDTQADDLTAYARARFPHAQIHVRTDLAGLDRALVVRT